MSRSLCCLAPVRIAGGSRDKKISTFWYLCQECGEACDAFSEQWVRNVLTLDDAKLLNRVVLTWIERGVMPREMLLLEALFGCVEWEGLNRWCAYTMVTLPDDELKQDEDDPLCVYAATPGLALKKAIGVLAARGITREKLYELAQEEGWREHVQDR